jgi:hypothetical protein
MSRRPVSDEAIAAAREKMADQREEVREYLAETVGGEPEDYDADQFAAGGDVDRHDGGNRVL